MAEDVVIRLEGVWKRYGLLPALQEGWSALRGRVADNEGDRWALRNVNLEVRRGEALGIVGRNGAGKSTLLKILAGVTPVTRGRVETHGRLFPMIELNAGLHMELTGRENVYLLGAIMGLSRREVQTNMAAIESFCELREYFDQPVRKYSSGMLARLGFGVAVNIEADIILIDEVLSVGDLAFQKKCLEKVSKLYQSGNTSILLVTHSPRQAERLCNRGLWLQSGELLLDDTMRKVTATYFEETTKGYKARLQQEGRLQPQIYLDTNEVSFEAVDILDATGSIAESVETGRPMSIRVKYKLKESVPALSFHFGFVTPDLLRLAVFNSIDQPNPLHMDTEGIVECHIKKLPLMPGIYGLLISVSTFDRALFKGENLLHFQVNDPSFEYVRHNMELVVIDAEWRFYSDRVEAG